MNLTIFLGFQKYFGFFDIIIILSFIGALILGYKKGFLEKFLNIANALCGFFAALVFSRGFAKVLSRWFYNPIYKKIFSNVQNSKGLANIQTIDNTQAGVKQALEQMGIPKFLSGIISKNVEMENIENIKTLIAKSISDVVTDVILVIIAFLFILIGVSLLVKVLKLLVKALRQSRGFKVADGILGVILYVFLDFVFLTVVFFVMSLVYQMAGLDSYNSFLINDMRLGTNKGLGIARWFYEDNIIGIFISLFI